MGVTTDSEITEITSTKTNVWSELATAPTHWFQICKMWLRSAVYKGSCQYTSWQRKPPSAMSTPTHGKFELYSDLIFFFYLRYGTQCFHQVDTLSVVCTDWRWILKKQKLLNFHVTALHLKVKSAVSFWHHWTNTDTILTQCHEC